MHSLGKSGISSEGFTSPCILRTVPWGHPGCMASRTCNTFIFKPHHKTSNSTLHQKQIDIILTDNHMTTKGHKIRKRQRSLHGDTVGGERPSSSLVVKSAVEILRPDVVELGVVLEGVDDALALDGVRALRIEVVGEEELLGAVERAAAALGLLGAVVPAHPHADAPAPIRLQPLHPRHVRRLVRVRRPHQHAVPNCTRKQPGLKS